MYRAGIFIGVIALFLAVAGPAALAVQYFEPYVGYSADSYPIGIASADFNGDTFPDLVTANNQGSSVSVLINDGDGSFAARVNYSTGASLNPYFVKTGDMDGDGNIDIVTGGSLGIVTFYGVGDGTFAAADVYYIAQQVLDLVIADFDNDTDLDIATSHAVRDSVGIHINNGDSTYTTHFVATGYGTVSLATGHLDGDNFVDILVGCSQGTVWNLKNDQAGSFIATEVHIGLLSDPAAVAVTDLNGDMIDDFVVTHAVNDFLFPYFNNGDGSYTVGSGHVLPDNPSSSMFADVNYDGDEDLLICFGPSADIKLYLNQGSGAFALDSSYTVGGTPKAMVYTDLNDDTYPDLAVASYTTDQAAVLLNRLALILSVDDVDTDGQLPTGFALEQNYPNPFNPETKIRFALPSASQVRVEVFNVLGQSVIVLVDEYLSAGTKEITWNGVSGSGQPVGSGMYFYRITADDFVEARKMLLIK